MTFSLKRLGLVWSISFFACFINMRYWTLNGFLMVLVIQQCTAEGVSSTEVSYQDGQTLSQEPELPAAEMVPVVSAPSLKDVQQAVQEASEQVEGRGAEEVLKELLERVVEAALGQAEEVSEAKDVVAVQEVVEEDVLGIQTEERNTEAEGDILEQPSEDENINFEKEYTGSIEKQEAVEVDVAEDVTEDVAAEGKEVVQGESETAASLEKSTESVETGVGKVEGLEVINESLGAEFSQEEVTEASEETDGDLEAGEAGDEYSREQVVLSVERNSAETEIENTEETPVAVEEAIGGQSDQETLNESEPSLQVVDEKQIGNDWEKEIALREETQIDEIEGEITVLPSNDFETKTTQSVVGEPVEEEDGVKAGEDSGGPTEEEQGHLVEGGNEEEVKVEGTNLGGPTGDDEIKEVSVTLVDEEDEDKTEDALEVSHDSDEETKEILVISGPQPDDGSEASIEQSPENKSATPEPPLEEMESQENTDGHEKSDHGNKLIIPTHQSTLDDFENDVLAEHTQAEGDEQGEADELMEDIPGIKETNQPDLEPWKIGAIFTAVFLVLETIVIIIYILKCRNQKSAPALQRACEEGCVEPEEATGGDCSDDTLPAGNGDTQQISMLEASDVASTLAKQQEQQQDELAIAMSDLSTSSTQELANDGPEPDPSQDHRTSI